MARRVAFRNFSVGLFVLAGILAVAWLSFDVGGLTLDAGNKITIYASFSEIGGLKQRAPVEIAGVRVGEVKSISLDDDYLARVELELDGALEFPIDTSASIVTAGLLGDRFVQLELGGEERLLQSGDSIDFTEPAMIFERLIGKFIHNTSLDD